MVTLRPSQVLPADGWSMAAFIGERASGKTTAALGWLVGEIEAGRVMSAAVVTSDARLVRVALDGLNQPGPVWSSSRSTLIYPNGAVVMLCSYDYARCLSYDAIVVDDADRMDGLTIRDAPCRVVCTGDKRLSKMLGAGVLRRYLRTETNAANLSLSTLVNLRVGVPWHHPLRSLVFALFSLADEARAWRTGPSHFARALERRLLTSGR